MDLKNLTNYQLVLLVLLVSFVTSIATGITTVYLLQQSPTVSSVINQVIQRTVETVTPSSSEIIKQSNQVVFIKESDLVPVIVDNIKKSIVSLDSPCVLTDQEILDGGSCLKTMYGFFTDAKGMFLATEKADPATTTATVYPGTKEYRAWNYVLDSKTENGLSYDLLTPSSKTLAVPHFLTFAKTLPKEGETLILYDPGKGVTKKFYVEKVDADKKKFTVDQSFASYVGLPILNLDGEVSGVIGMTDSGAVLFSSVEITSLTFTKTSLTDN